MPATPEDVIAHAKLIRRCFQLMKTLGDRLHAGEGMNASLRATLEWLSEHGEQTVPRIASAKSVSRQHVQKTVDELLERGLVELRPNPGHKRSPFVALTSEGAALFAAMREREGEVIARIAAEADGAGLARSIAQLQKLHDILRQLSRSSTLVEDDDAEE